MIVATCARMRTERQSQAAGDSESQFASQTRPATTSGLRILRWSTVTANLALRWAGPLARRAVGMTGVEA
jgi:hypothetical protein